MRFSQIGSATSDRSEFAAQLRRLRDAAGLTQEELAERAGLTAAGVNALERGHRRRPHPRTVRALAAALGLTDADRDQLLKVSHLGAPTTITDGSDRPLQQSLPVPMTNFAGRQREVREIQRLLGTTRLLTLTGPGGVGKTTLEPRFASWPDFRGYYDIKTSETTAIVVILYDREPAPAVLQERLGAARMAIADHVVSAESLSLWVDEKSCGRSSPGSGCARRRLRQ